MDFLEFSNKLKSNLKKCDIEIENEIAEKFYIYMNMLLEWNKNVNLTAITKPDEIILKHFVDSGTILKQIKEYDKVLDIGTGAGFPGIPLKLLNKDIDITLVDSLNKRINFLIEVIDELKIEKINVIHARAEELARDHIHREEYDIVTSRAVANMCVLLEYTLPFLRIGGKCICMKGPNIDEELEESRKALQILGGRIERIEKILLPSSDIERNIIVVKKINETPKQYPRKAGKPSKEPIK